MAPTAKLWTQRDIQLRGIPLLFAGAAFAALAFHSLSWYAVDAGADSAGAGFTFTDLRDNADSLGAPVAVAYFDRLAWALVALVVVLGLAAKIGSTASGALRVAGFLTGFAGAALTFYALAQLFNAQQVAGGSDHGVLHSSSVGLWAAVGGYLLAAFGAVLGSAGGGTTSPSDTIE